MAVTKAFLEQAYLAYFGRPIDPNGVVWYTQPGMTQAQVEQEFSTSAESKALYPDGATVATINAIYMTLFGREADIPGATWWANEIAQGKVTLAGAAIAILQGAQGSDKIIVENKLAASHAFTAGLDTMEEIVGFSGDAAITVAREWLATVTTTPATPAQVNAAIEASVAASNPPPPSPVGETFILTVNQDVFTGGDGDDQFLATGATLQLGDMLNGGGGQDTLSLSLTNGQGEDTAFSAQSIETFKVKSLQWYDHSINMSDVSGVTEIQSNESSGALYFDDIQSVNNIDVSITDTSATHSFNYDTNAFTAGVDAVDLRLAEVAGAQINFTTGSSSVGVEQINIDSQDNPNPIAGDSDATVNNVSDLNVGDKLEVVNIKGNADLTVGAPLDVNVRLVDAHTLDGNLTLDLSNSNDGNPGSTGDDASTVEEIVYIGAMQNDHVEFGSTDNAKNVKLGNGNDWVRTGTGVASVDGGSGNDTIITGALNDLVIGGTGNDVVTDAGADNATTGWTTRYVAGGNSFSLGDGNDSLTVTGSGNNTADLGAGNDSMLVGAAGNSGIVSGNQVVTAGDGNDGVTLYANGTANVDLGAGNDTLVITRNQTNTSTVTAGDGNDSVTINSSGNVNGTGGEGNDSFAIYGNGGHTIDTGAGDDSLTIVGDGTHNLTLGSGNDYLNIVGARNTNGNADNGATDGVTVINAGDGNDSVWISADHYLGADLGNGNDDIHLRAKDLTSDDTVAGGAGNDSIWLSNETQNSQDGRVLASETIHTTGFETYELLDSNITLKLTDRMITTAENMDLTVSTVNSNSTDLPGLYDSATGWIYPLAQGMTNVQFDALIAQTRAGSFYQTPDAPMLHDKAYYDNLPGGESARLAAADADLRAYISQFVTIDNTDTNADGDTTDDLDQLFFLKETGVQTVDMTGITTPEYKFTLEGGNVADIVIGNDATINGQMTLNYNYGGSSSTPGSDRTALSVEDTLVVMGGAEITAADLRHVDGLERIVLKGGGNGVAQTWGIELTDRVIDQTTGSATLEIIVDPNVEAGSKVYITLDPSIVNANNDVVIRKNANVQVYINGDLVSEPELGQDFNPGINSITVVNELVFTSNSDNLVGTSGNDTFTANQLSHIQAGDSANGNGGFNTLELNFAVSNGANTLQEMFNDASLTDIDRIEFNTGNNVTFGGIGLGYASSLQSLATNEGNDTLTNMRQGLLYELNAGNDSLSLVNINAGTVTTTVDGGAGSDSVTGSSGNDLIAINSVESVDGLGGSDRVDMLAAGTVTTWQVESVNGSTGADTIYADVPGGPIVVDGRGGNDYIDVGDNTPTDATVYGGSGNDTVYVLATNSAVVYGDDNNTVTADGNDSITVGSWWSGSTVDNVTVYAEGGNDTVTVYADVQASVSGGNGNDSLYVTGNDWWWSGNQLDNATVDGGAGDDTITVGSTWWNNGVVNATVTGGSGVDSIVVNGEAYIGNLNASGGSENDSVTVYYGEDVTVTGDSGDDTLNAYYFGNSASVDGGSGNDIITVTSYDSTSVATVLGGEGKDDITVTSYLSDTATITGGAGDDKITLNVSETSGQETLVFGNVTYDGLQNPLLNTQGQDTIKGFNWEPSGPTAGAQDLLDFSAFNGGTTAVVFSGNMAGGGDVNVVSTTNNALILTNANWASSGYTMADNEAGVLIIGKDTNGQNGYDHFDVYYVQDVDAGAGVAVKVDLVGKIDSATDIGLATITTANFI